MARFTLQIALTNDAMRTPHDVAAALEETARRLRKGAFVGSIADITGNKAGHYVPVGVKGRDGWCRGGWNG